MGYSYETADRFNYSLLKQFAIDNRKNPSEAELVLWKCIRNYQLGVSFRRQHIIGEYIADFVCLPVKLIIEVDGKYHQLPNQEYKDREREDVLIEKGYKIIRFTNEEVLFNTNQVIEKIKKEII